MKVAVCVRRVPDTSEAEVRVDDTGKDIVKDRLAFTINEADNYALEEALLLKDSAGAEVTLVTVGAKEVNDVLRMGLAKGAARAVRIDDAGLESVDGIGLARVLGGFFKGEEPAEGDRHSAFDLVLCGCIAQDVEDSQVGPALAQFLGWPHAAYVIKLEVKEGKLEVRRELEGGLLEVKEVGLPCVLTIQTGGNTPRYASILGIKRAGAKPVDEQPAGEAPEPGTRLLRLYKPEVVSAAEMIGGDVPAKALRVAQIVKEKGLL